MFTLFKNMCIFEIIQFVVNRFLKCGNSHKYLHNVTSPLKFVYIIPKSYTCGAKYEKD